MNTMTMQVNNNSGVNEVYEHLKNYVGTNNFINSLKSFFLRKGFLTEGQLPHAIKFFEEQKQSVKLVGAEIVKETAREILVLNNAVTIKLNGAYFVKMLCEEKLKLGSLISYAWTVTKVTGQTQKAIRVVATIPNSSCSLNFCRACGKQLTNEFSVATGMGPVCSSNYGVEYITDLSQVEDYKKLLDLRIAEAGEHEFWLPKSKIEYEYMNLLIAEMQTAKKEVVFDEEVVEKIDLTTVNIKSQDVVTKVMDLIMEKYKGDFDYSSLSQKIFVLELNEQKRLVSLSEASDVLPVLFAEQNTCNAILHLVTDETFILTKKQF